MADIGFEDIIPELMPSAPQCPYPTFIRSIRNSIRELCENSFCFRYQIEDEPVTAGDAEVYFNLPVNTFLQRPIALTINGGVLQPTSVIILDEDDTSWRTRTGDPLCFVRSTVNLSGIRLVPTPTTTLASGSNGIAGEVALQISRDSTAIDEIFLEKYQDTIVSGALSRVMGMKGPWYDPVVAANYQRMFSEGVRQAKSLGNSDDLPKRRTVRYGGYDSILRDISSKRLYYGEWR